MTGPTHKLILPPISLAAPGALYQQIVDGLKKEISEGRLPAGTSLPSFRALAEDLMVSLITVKRAYEELEREGIIFRRQGLGTFVSEQGELRSQEAKKRRARDLLVQAWKEAAEAGLQEKELVDLLKEVIRKHGGNE